MPTISISSEALTAMVLAGMEALPSKALPQVLDVLARVVAGQPTGTAGRNPRAESAKTALQVLEAAVPLAPLLYQSLSPASLRAFLLIALDRFAIDGNDADVAAVTEAAVRFVAATCDPSTVPSEE